MVLYSLSHASAQYWLEPGAYEVSLATPASVRPVVYIGIRYRLCLISILDRPAWYALPAS